MKKIVTVLLTFAFTLGFVFAQANANSEDDFEFSVNDDFSEITLTAYKGERKDVVIPATIQDVPVVNLGSYLFCGKDITSVVIPESVKRIQGGYEYDGKWREYSYYGAFSCCNSLTSVTLPKGVSIENYAFFYCESLASLTVQDDSSIGSFAFEGCSKLSELTLGENVKVGNYAFERCESLKSLAILKGSTLGTGAFEKCPSLSSVKLAEDIAFIPQSCFSECTNLSLVNFPSSLKCICDDAFKDCPIANVDLPNGLEYLGSRAFFSNAIVSVSLPKSLKYVMKYEGEYAIYSDNIESITIPERLEPKLFFSKKEEEMGGDFIEILDTAGMTMDGRDLVSGEKISKTIKLQKALSSFKMTTLNASNCIGHSYSPGEKDIYLEKQGDFATKKTVLWERFYYYFVFTEEGKQLYEDLVSYGLSKSDARGFCATY